MKRVNAPELLHLTDSLLHVLLNNLCSSYNKKLVRQDMQEAGLDVDYSKDLD